MIKITITGKHRLGWGLARIEQQSKSIRVGDTGINSLITPSSGNTEINSLITSDTEMNSLITTGGKILLINEEVSESIHNIIYTLIVIKIRMTGKQRLGWGIAKFEQPSKSTREGDTGMNSLITPSSGNTEMNSLITSDTEMNSLITTGGKILLINEEVSESIHNIIYTLIVIKIRMTGKQRLGWGIAKFEQPSKSTREGDTGMNSLITPSSGNTEMNSLITSDTEINSLITTGGKILLINEDVSNRIPYIVYTLLVIKIRIKGKQRLGWGIARIKQPSKSIREGDTG